MTENLKSESTTPPLSYYPTSEIVLRADSFLLIGQIDSARNYYNNSHVQRENDSLYALIRLQSLQSTKLNNKRIHSEDPYLNTLYIIHTSADSTDIDYLKTYISGINSHLTSWDSAAIFNRIAKYYQEDNFVLDSAWHYIEMAYECSKSIDGIYAIDFEIIIRYMDLCTNKRELTRAIKLGRDINNFDNYKMLIDSNTQAKAIRALGYQLFRIGQHSKTTLLNQEALKLNINTVTKESILLSESYNLLTTPATSMKIKDSLFNVTLVNLKNICIINGSLFSYYRVLSYHYYLNKQYKKALPIIHNILNDPQIKKNYPLRLACLHMLSDCYLNLNLHKKAIQTYQKIQVPEYNFIKLSKISKLYLEYYKKKRTLKLLTKSNRYIEGAISSYRKEINQFELNDIKEYRNALNDIFNTYIENKYENYKLKKDNKHISAIINTIEFKRNLFQYKVPYFNFISSNNPLLSSLQQKDKEGSTMLENLNRTFQTFNLELCKQFCLQNNSQILLYEITDDIALSISVSGREIRLQEYNKDSLLMISRYLSESNNNGSRNLTERSNKNAIFYCTYLKPTIDSSDNLFLYLDEDLHLVNFGELVINKVDSKYVRLLENKSIIYLSSLEHLKLEPVTSKSNKIALFCFSDNESIISQTYFDGLPELPSSYRECKIIASMFNKHLLYAGNNCTKDNFIKSLQDSTISHIHLATHAKATTERNKPIEIYFKDNDFIDTLRGHEILPYHLKNKSFTLSLCQGDFGYKPINQGMITFSSYLKFSGADKVISSTIQIDDATSASLFNTYYSTGSLSASQVELLSSNNYPEIVFSFREY